VLVTREADYAVRCVLEVARHGRVSAARVAELQGISPTFLGKIVQSLARAGILSTRRGVGGGVSLAVPLEQITLLRVIEAVEGPLCLNDCVADPPQCPQLETCPVYPYLDRAQEALRELLTVNLSEMAREPVGDATELAGLKELRNPDLSPDGKTLLSSIGGEG
jgi:Rrf2 family protein